MPNPRNNETHDDFITRCMGDEESKTSFPDESQRYAVCESKWSESKMTSIEKYLRAFVTSKISFDFDGVLTTSKGRGKAAGLIMSKNTVYIISARSHKDGMLKIAESLGIPESRIYAMGSNKAKVEKIKELRIDTHYDNNPDVIKELGLIGKLFTFAESYTDYPQAATENAKIALRWADENGWGECGTPVGKARANQLANREPISQDTISRMAGFERHRQNSDKELGDGCGRLMWLAWGGDEGIEWAQRKLEQLKNG